MSKRTPEKITVYAYAKKLGLTGPAVNNAIKAKKIVKGYDVATKRILVEVANEEWGFKHLKTDDAEAAEQLTPDEIADIAEAAGINPDDILIHTSLAYNELVRRREIIGALLDKNKLLEQNGLLVRRATVDAELFAAGNQLRKSLEVIGARVIANVLAAPDPVTAQAFIDNEIRATLIRFTTDRLNNTPADAE